MKQTSLKKKQDVEIYRQAVALAASGEFSDWRDIESNLVEKGFNRAPDLLDAATIRAILDARCQSTRRRQAAR